MLCWDVLSMINVTHLFEVTFKEDTSFLMHRWRLKKDIRRYEIWASKEKLTGTCPLSWQFQVVHCMGTRQLITIWSLNKCPVIIEFVSFILSVCPIFPNTNIDSNHLHHCVKYTREVRTLPLLYSGINFRYDSSASFGVMSNLSLTYFIDTCSSRLD